ncbi:MAG: DinB family protein, partial [Anaerolineae bacterium]|nr:DinB family protein [Anaerolineae bacterium]
MDELWKKVLKSQFIASIEMLSEAISACPDELWQAKLWDDLTAPPGFSDFWYVTYHALFWLDLYLSGTAEGFTPPAPFDLNELEPQGVLPEKVFTKDELLAYLDHCRLECSR